MKRGRVSSGGPWEDRVGYSRAVRAGDHVWVSGTTGTHNDGSIPDGIAAQARLALTTIEQALIDAGASIEDVVMVRTYVVDITEWELAANALRSHFEVNRHHVVLAALTALAEDGTVPASAAAEAITRYGIDPDKPEPAHA